MNDKSAWTQTGVSWSTQLVIAPLCAFRTTLNKLSCRWGLFIKVKGRVKSRTSPRHSTCAAEETKVIVFPGKYRLNIFGMIYTYLSIFKGYHDVLSVLILTFNEQVTGRTQEEATEMLNLAAEKLSLQRLRDSMGPGLEPLVGLLR